MEGSCPSSGKKFIFKNANSQKNVSRETAIFSTSLEFNNKRSNDSFSNSRVRNPIQKSPSAGKTPNTRDRSVEIHVNRSGNTRAFGKRGNISNIFNKRGVFKQSVSGPKEEWGSTSSDKPKKSEQISTLKMEGFHSLTHMLKKGDFLCKIDLKDAYFSVPLHKSSRKFVRFQWAGNLYEFGSLCFGLAPAPRIFTKILKTPISILRRLNIRVVIYLDDMLILGSTIEELLCSRDTIIYLLQHLGFVINWNKSFLSPVQEIDFLGLLVNSKNMTLSLTESIINHVQSWN